MSENEKNAPDDTSELVQVNIRMAKDLKEKCVKQAVVNRLSLQEWIRRALNNQIELEELSESDSFKEALKTIDRISKSPLMDVLEQLTDGLGDGPVLLECPKCHMHTFSNVDNCPSCGTPLKKK